MAAADSFPNPQKAKKLEILAGFLVYPAFEDEYQDGFEIDTLTFHEKYKESPLIYNIAIVKVKEPIEYSLAIGTVCLPLGKSFQDESFFNRKRKYNLVAWPKYK